MRKAAPPLPPGQYSRFSDMSGYLLTPDEPPTRIDAAAVLWGAWFRKEREDFPDAQAIAAELKRLQALHAAGKWHRV